MTNLILGTVLVVGIPLILILIFSYLDKELTEVIKLKPKTLIIILCVGLISSILYYIFCGHFEKMYYLHCMVLLGYLIFMSYTDQLTTLLYSSVSVVMITAEIVSLLININIRELEIYTLIIFAFPVVFSIMSLFRWIGFGDVLIYCVLTLFLIQYRLVPTMSMIINVLITNILFIIVTLLLRRKERHRPLTIFITISTFLCNLLLI